jgi:hypothetical protein
MGLKEMIFMIMQHGSNGGGGGGLALTKVNVIMEYLMLSISFS